MAANYLTTGRWSPTRPGMLFLGKVDGSMDVWDFTDSSFTPSVTLMSSPSRITRWVVWCDAVRCVGVDERDRETLSRTATPLVRKCTSYSLCSLCASDFARLPVFLGFAKLDRRNRERTIRTRVSISKGYEVRALEAGGSVAKHICLPLSRTSAVVSSSAQRAA